LFYFLFFALFFAGKFLRLVLFLSTSTVYTPSPTFLWPLLRHCIFCFRDFKFRL
jgi:hypothetical protein